MRFYVEVDFTDAKTLTDQDAIRAITNALKSLRPNSIKVESDLDRHFNDELRPLYRGKSTPPRPEQ